ncbi:hypothetical protein [Thalassobacillus pellis]|uniref:hypothetical protein n=1 Tax=Thalassobacillus pellis TaxID=748008 RepID=UPI001960E48A|nr:hypothetical protein [Thalassobacillus pellis]MBM7551173.1 multisubunit Na+/H+ antiporter MnhG subunit [Thalassobacillus pellis]
MSGQDGLSLLKWKERKSVMGNKLQLLFWVILGSAVLCAFFLLISFTVAGTDTALRVMVIITEVFGAIALIAGILGIIYLRDNNDRWLSISVVSFAGVWVWLAVVFEIGLNSPFNNYWLLFITYYIFMIASIVFLRMAFTKIKTIYKVLPAVVLFANALLTVYMIFLNMWWSLPI